jgi:DNA-binding NarL/FixJ family response regulator
VRVVVAEDQHLLRSGLVRLLEGAGFTVAAAVATGPELRAALADLRPDVSIVDVRLPPTLTDEGLWAAVEARGRTPALPVLVLSQHVEELYARELLADGRGAVGYLLKDRVFTDDQFLDAVRAVAGGATVIDPEVVAALIAAPGPRRGLDRLTARERDVLTELAEGRSNAAISAELHLSTSAVTKHIAAIFDKLGLAASGQDNRRVLAVLEYLRGPS